MKLPRHRPIDVQSAEAGPVVGKSETVVRFRNTEYFLIKDLDLQSRLHYAPRDSKMHSVEIIMSTLTKLQEMALQLRLINRVCIRS